MLNFAKARLGFAVAVDWFDVAVIAAFVVGLAWYLVVRARRRVEAAVDIFSGPGRFVVVFAKGVVSSALPVEVDLCAEAEVALITLGWDNVGKVSFWPVRSAGQEVVYRGRRLPWRDVPGVVGIEPRGDGYGGMRDGASIYVAFYHVGREADALMAHELTHARLVGVDHGEERFLVEEMKLLAEMRRS